MEQIMLIQILIQLSSVCQVPNKSISQHMTLGIVPVQFQNGLELTSFNNLSLLVRICYPQLTILHALHAHNLQANRLAALAVSSHYVLPSRVKHLLQDWNKIFLLISLVEGIALPLICPICWKFHTLWHSDV